MASKKEQISGGFSALERDKRLTLPDRSISLRDERFAADPQELEIAFLEKIVAQDPIHEDALRILAQLYTSSGMFEKGLEIDRRLVKLRPDDPVAAYNLACSLSLLGQIEAACEELRRAFDLGFRPLSQIESDPDLANLRESAQYKAFISEVRRRRPGNGVRRA
jgi:tetratricopeptide (TPR) repeat protein